jgi:hypothetical protein
MFGFGSTRKLEGKGEKEKTIKEGKPREQQSEDHFHNIMRESLTSIKPDGLDLLWTRQGRHVASSLRP